MSKPGIETYFDNGEWKDRVQGSSPATSRDDPDDDFLKLGDPERRHRTFAHLGLLVLGAGVALFLFPLLLRLTFAGSLLDVIALILWLGSASLALVGFCLLGVAGIKTLMRKAPFSTLG